MTDLSLESRDGLPEALRVLLAEYPKAEWEDDPGFEGLVRFWLDRHIMFRRILDQLRTATEAMIDRSQSPDRYAAALSRYGGMFVNGLHEHHMIEDTYYFPKLAARDARVSRGFEILDKDHHAIDAHLQSFVTGANAILDRREDPDALHDHADRFHTELARLNGFLDRHLTDEEELIVPIILKYGSADLGG